MWRPSALYSFCLLLSAPRSEQTCHISKELLTCSFRQGYCGWEKLHMSKTASGTSSYLRLENAESYGFLRSHETCKIPRNESRCLQFRFYLNPENAGYLDVTIIRRSSTRTIAELWSFSAGTSQWTDAAVPISSDLPYILKIRAWRHKYFQESVKIANITFTDSACQLRPRAADPNAPPTPAEVPTGAIVGVVVSVAFAAAVTGAAFVWIFRRRGRQPFRKCCCAAEEDNRAARRVTATHADVPDEEAEDSVYNHLGDVIPPADHRQNRGAEGPGGGGGCDGEGEDVYNRLGGGAEGFYSQVGLEKKRVVVIDEVYSHLQ